MSNVHKPGMTSPGAVAVPLPMALACAIGIVGLALAAALLPSFSDGRAEHDAAIIGWIDPLRQSSTDTLRAATEADRSLRSFLLLSSAHGDEESSYTVARGRVAELLPQVRTYAGSADPETKQRVEAFAQAVDYWMSLTGELETKNKREGRASAQMAFVNGVGVESLKKAQVAYDQVEKRLSSLRSDREAAAKATEEAPGKLRAAAIGAAILAGVLGLWIAMKAGRPAALPRPALDAEQLRMALDQVPDGVAIVGMEGLLVSNFAAGRVREAGDGRPRRIAIFRGEDEPIGDDEDPLLLALAGEKIAGRQLFVQRPSGSFARVSVTAEPVVDESGQQIGAVATFKDQTEVEHLAAEMSVTASKARTAEEALADSKGRVQDLMAQLAKVTANAERLAVDLKFKEDRFSSLIGDARAVGIALFDARELRLLDVNEHGLVMLGERRRARDARGSTLGELVPRADEFGLTDIFRRVATTGEAYANDEYRSEGRRHGVGYWRFSLTRVDGGGQGKADQLLFVGVDITEDVAERETAEAERVASHEHTLEDLLIAVSNDLRTPVHSIQGMVELFRQKYAEAVPDVTALHYLELTKRNADQMAALVDDLAELSRLGRGDLAPSDVPLSAVVEEAWRASEHGGIDLRVAGPLPVVKADRSKLIRAMRDMFGVASRLRKDGAGSFIQVSARDIGSKWAIEVSDNGKGFKVEDAETLFGPLAHNAAEHTRNGSAQIAGPGIGLAAVRRIAELHGGETTAVGRPDQGSTFSMTLAK